MTVELIKNSNFYRYFTYSIKMSRIMGVRPICIILPLILSLATAFFDGASLWLLIPLAKGIMGDYSFVKTTPTLKNIIDFFQNISPSALSSKENIFLLLVILVFIATLLKNITSYCSRIMYAYWHGKFKNNVYNFVFDRILSFGKLFFDRTNQGYITLVLHYSDAIINLLNLFENLANNLFTLAVYLGIMMVISWKMTIITLLIFPIFHYVLKSITEEIHKVAALRNALQIEMHRNVFNILACITLIKAYSREEETKKMYSDVQERLRKAGFRSEKMFGLIWPIQDLITTAAILLMFSVVTLFLLKDKPAEISVFAVFFYASRRALPLFGIFNQCKAVLADAKPPIKELLKVFDDENKFFVHEGNGIFSGIRSMIEIRHLSFSYLREHPVLRNVSFTIEKNRATAIVGPSGAGKTTLISLLMRFYDCAPASILIDGTDIRDFTLKSLREHIAIVSQDVLLFNDTFRNNMVFGLDKKISEDELVEAAKKVRLYDFITQLPNGFDTEIGDRGVKLSGGEKQRVAIARALLKGSEILILDEATSALDSATEKLVQEAIDAAVKERTVIVIAHRLSTIKSADKIIVLEDGYLIEEGTQEELLEKKGKFYQYLQTQKFH